MMSDLPSREETLRFLHDPDTRIGGSHLIALGVLDAYVSEELKTETEWREATEVGEVWTGSGWIPLSVLGDHWATGVKRTAAALGAKIIIPPGATFIAKGVHFYGITVDGVQSDQPKNIVEGCYFYPVDAALRGTDDEPA